MQETVLSKDLKEENKMSLASLEEEGGEVRFNVFSKKHSPFVGGAGWVQIWLEKCVQEQEVPGVQRLSAVLCLRAQDSKQPLNEKSLLTSRLV